MNTRNAAVEGQFYPATKERIFEQIREIEQANRYMEPELSPLRIIGAVLPHAGHIYSGYQTTPFFQLIKRLEMYPKTFIIIHPNHSGLGQSIAVDDSDVWHNSIGEVPLDRDFAVALDLPFDRFAHFKEHSAEVIIPFMQYYSSDHPFSIVPICMRDQSYYSASLIAKQIKNAVRETGHKIMLIASCDFSHFLSPEDGQIKDQHILENILARNAQGIEVAVKKHQISACGYGPIMTLMEYARTIEPEYKVEILARGHSGEVIPSREVVDYISMMIYQ